MAVRSGLLATASDSVLSRRCCQARQSPPPAAACQRSDDSPGIPLPDYAHMHAAGRCGRVVARVELEPRARPDLTEVTRAVIRTGSGEDRARVAGAVGILEERPQHYLESRRERDRDAWPDEQLLLAHAVHAVRLRAVGLVAHAVEPKELESRRAQLDIENRRKERSPELTRHLYPVRVRAGRVGGLGEQPGAGRQGVGSVPWVSDPEPDQ